MTLASDLIINSSAYGFCSFDDQSLAKYREELYKLAKQINRTTCRICGTILLSREGVNIRLSGDKEAVSLLQERLRSLHPKLHTMEYKDSTSQRLTLPRFLVKIKKEVIAMGVPELDNVMEHNATYLDPQEFKSWVDHKKDMIVLDTRNDYEVRLGRFQDAVDLNIKSFRSFPANAKIWLDSVPKEKPIVMYCTGGVRCEKASCVLLHEGFTKVYQLHGGILKYFEKVGASHFNGNCYVFDDRVAIGPDLVESDVTNCYNCRSPLTKADRATTEYEFEKHCPYCIKGKSDFRHA